MIARLREWWEFRKAVRTVKRAMRDFDAAEARMAAREPDLSHLPDREGIWRGEGSADNFIYRKIPWDEAEAKARADGDAWFLEIIQRERRILFTESEYPD